MEAAQLLGCSPNRIRAAEEDGRLSPPPEGSTGRRLGYAIEDILHMREVLAASPRRRSKAPETMRRSSQSKTSKVGSANPRSLRTLRTSSSRSRAIGVLVVDWHESQATTTTLFGFNPHFQIPQEATLYPHLALEATQDDLGYAIHTAPLAERRPYSQVASNFSMSSMSCGRGSRSSDGRERDFSSIEDAPRGSPGMRRRTTTQSSWIHLLLSGRSVWRGHASCHLDISVPLAVISQSGFLLDGSVSLNDESGKLAQLREVGLRDKLRFCPDYLFAVMT